MDISWMYLQITIAYIYQEVDSINFIMSLTHKPNPFGQILCWSGRHLISEEDEQELIDSPTGRYETMCDRCHRKIILEIDPENEDEYFIKEPND
ncbi:hypothetical protein NVIE_022660 [Nitrososphaera viennensis EN76]|uniref:Uncharacterized protein n=1 Tax=Nitrososphaera viennensis EN76 TaxID=926571 RepID=A0A060HM34_9ARCH|nr:hypothetical protein NVIE_022660 [Nitrososphaera viennensis EN76]